MNSPSLTVGGDFLYEGVRIEKMEKKIVVAKRVFKDILALKDESDLYGEMKAIRFFFVSMVLLAAVCVAHERPHQSKVKYTPPTEPIVIGQGDWRYQLVPSWGLGAESKIEVGHCHAMVQSKSGLVYLANTHPKNSIVVFTTKGELVDAWGDFLPSAHGLSIVEEGGEEFLFITDNSRGGKIVKTTLKGEVVMQINCPMESGLYESPQEFRPSRTIILPNGDLIVLDGYGKDYVLRFDAHGKYLSAFGGDLGTGEAKIAHFGPHGGNLDLANPARPDLILALSDKQRMKRFSMDGTWLETIHLPGSNPRDVSFHRDHIIVPHLSDDWPGDRNAAGFISVLDRNFKVVANLGGKPPVYHDGKLQPMTHDTHAWYPVRSRRQSLRSSV
jgi:peptidylamidoglycolate lyase